MSWYPIYLGDLDLEIEQKKIIWTCPRCGERQSTNFDVKDYLYGLEISCQNVDICGERQAYFELELSVGINGQKGLSDRPLEKATKQD